MYVRTLGACVYRYGPVTKSKLFYIDRSGMRSRSGRPRERTHRSYVRDLYAIIITHRQCRVAACIRSQSYRLRHRADSTLVITIQAEPVTATRRQRSRSTSHRFHRTRHTSHTIVDSRPGIPIDKGSRDVIHQVALFCGCHCRSSVLAVSSSIARYVCRSRHASFMQRVGAAQPSLSVSLSTLASRRAR